MIFNYSITWINTSLARTQESYGVFNTDAQKKWQLERKSKRHRTGRYGIGECYRLAGEREQNPV